MFFVYLFLFFASSFLPISGKVTTKPNKEISYSNEKPVIEDLFISADQIFIKEEKGKLIALIFMP